MAKRHRRHRRSGDIGIGDQIVIAVIIAFFLLSGGASIVNHYLGFLDLSWLGTGQIGDQYGLILGIVAIVVGALILVGRLVGGIGRHRWSATVLGIHSLADIYAMSPGKFEEFVGFLFKEQGYDARVVGQTGDQGIDIELRRREPGAPRVVAQCKRYRGSVGQPVVREFYGSFADRAAEGYLITTGTFTQPAREWAATRPLKLIDGQALMRWTEQVASKHRDQRLAPFVTAAEDATPGARPRAR